MIEKATRRHATLQPKMFPKFNWPRMYHSALRERKNWGRENCTFPKRPEVILSQMLVGVARTLADEIHRVLLIPDELAESHHRVHGGLRDDIVSVVEHRRRHHRHSGARSEKAGLAGGRHPAIRSMGIVSCIIGRISISHRKKAFLGTEEPA